MVLWAIQIFGKGKEQLGEDRLQGIVMLVLSVLLRPKFY